MRSICAVVVVGNENTQASPDIETAGSFDTHGRVIGSDAMANARANVAAGCRQSFISRVQLKTPWLNPKDRRIPHLGDCVMAGGGHTEAEAIS